MTGDAGQTSSSDITLHAGHQDTGPCRLVASKLLDAGNGISEGQRVAREPREELINGVRHWCTVVARMLGAAARIARILV